MQYWSNTFLQFQLLAARHCEGSKKKQFMLNNELQTYFFHEIKKPLHKWSAERG